MKLAKYLLIATGAILVLATIAWFLRDNLIERLSNPLLDDYGLAIVDVSLDALASRDASISYLELRHEKGTTIVIEDLTLPYAAASKKLKTYQARKVSIITATRTDGAAFDIAELIRQAVSLPANIGSSVIIVDEFNLPPYPTVRRVRWNISDAGQQLEASVDAVDLSVGLTPVDAASHDAVFSLLSAPGDSNSLNARLDREDARFLLKGDGVLDLPAWQALIRLVGFVPAEVELLSGTAALAFNVEVPEDPLRTPTLSAELTPSSPITLNYRNDDGEIAAVHFRSAASANISATFPDVDWSLNLAKAEMTVGYRDWKKIPVSLENLACTAGPTCSLTTHVAVKDAALPIGNVGRAEFSSSEHLHFLETGLRVDVQPGARLNINGLRSEATALQRIQARLVSAATLSLRDDGWHVAADSVDAEVDALATGEAASVSMPLFLESISGEQRLEQLSLAAGVFAPSGRATWKGSTLALPGFKGRVSLNGSGVVAELRTVGLHKEAAIQARHDLGSGTGQVSVSAATVSFGKQHLSDRISPWRRDLDIVAGRLSFNVSADWQQKKTGLAFSGQAAVSAVDLAGYYGDSAFTGLSTEIRVRHQDDAGFIAEPSKISVALIDLGIPIENLSADFQLDLATPGADVSGLRMSAFGGTVTAEPFSFYTAGDSNTLVLSTETLDLAEVLSLQGFEMLQVTGTVSARMPLSIQGNSMTIADGVLTGNAPGGVIRYQQAQRPDKSDTSRLGFAKRVLSNFEYTSLASDMNLSQEGDLTLKLRLTGRNPDLEEKRPVVLNVEVENNIPQMLRSLRAARAVEDVLEKRLAR